VRGRYEEAVVALYQQIVDDVMRRLDSGEFKPGDRMYTIDELRRSFNVSSTTAVRAVEELKKQQLVESIQGKGSFFVGLPKTPIPAPEPLRRMRVVSPYRDLFAGGFQTPICRGIERIANAEGLALALEYLPSADVHGRGQLPFAYEPGDGLIILGPISGRQLYPALVESEIRAVLVDSLSAGINCVATDNLGGMAQLIDHLAALGHRSLLFVGASPASPNPANENERAAAFAFLAADRGLTAAQLRTVDAASVIQHVRTSPTPPTAVLFAQDAPAALFLDAAADAGLRIPDALSVTGFDGFVSGRPGHVGLTTIAVDGDGLGRAAAQALLDHPVPGTPVRPWIRVAGKLVHGRTTARPHSEVPS
jgi:DNA-binding LacI/PurR family transcriptional regulator